MSWAKGGGEKSKRTAVYKSILRNVRIVLGMRRNHQTQIRAGPTDIERRGGCGACSLLALSHDMTGDRRQATGDKRACLDSEGSERGGEARRE